MGKHLSDAQVCEAIKSLKRTSAKLTGSVVRAELRRRHGLPGGVARVYRLLQEAQGGMASVDQQELIAENAGLKAKLAAAIGRAELAEYREESHQAHWAMEVDSLRQQLREALVDRRQLSALQGQVFELHRRIRELTANG